MYRIMTARNGFYYVQEQLGPCRWSRCSRFYYYHAEAMAFVKANKKPCKCKCHC